MAAREDGLSVFSLRSFLWRSYWRNVGKGGLWKNANMMTVTVFSLLGLPVLGLLWAFTAISFLTGESQRGLMLSEIFLTGIMVGWIVLPLLIGSVTGRGQGLELARLMQFPLSAWKLFQVGVLTCLMQPVYWVLLLGSVLSLVVLGFGPHPVQGIVAGLLLVLSAAVLSWAIGLLLSTLVSSRRGREIGLGILAFGMAPVWILISGDYSFDDDSLTITLLDRTYLLFDETGRQGILAALRSWTPSAWVTGVMSGSGTIKGILSLGGLLAVSLLVAVLSLKRQLAHPPESIGTSAARLRTMGPLLGLPAALGTATAKELRYLSRTLDALMGYVSGGIASIWMILKPEHGPYVIALVMPAIVFNEMVIPLNNFGLDGKAVDRYRLLPLSSRQVVMSKNLAYLLLVLIELAAPVLVALFRVGAPYTLACLCGCLSVCCLTMAWGNFVSIRSPAPREFFNFDSSEQAGGMLPILYSLAIWAVPGGLGIGLMSVGPWAFLGGEILLLGLAAGVWVATLGSAGRQFENQAESMREKLAG